jgi:hypothetical protein
MRRAIAGDLLERHAGNLLGIADPNADSLTERFSLGQPVSVAERIAPAVPVAVPLTGAVSAAIADPAAGLSITQTHTHVDARNGR